MKYECAEPELKPVSPPLIRLLLFISLCRFVECAYVNGDWQCLATEREVNRSLKGDYVVRFAINSSSFEFV